MHMPEKFLVKCAFQNARNGAAQRSRISPLRATLRFYGADESGAGRAAPSFGLLAQASIVAGRRGFSVDCKNFPSVSAGSSIQYFSYWSLLRSSSRSCHVGVGPWSALASSQRRFGMLNTTASCRAPKNQDQIQRVESEEKEEDDSGEQKDPGAGYLPFPPPFHTFNIIMILFLLNILCYVFMRYGNDDLRDFIVEHFTLSRENWTRVYPLVTNALFQENLLQLLIDCWLLSSVGNTLLSFVGNARLSWLALLCILGGDAVHLLQQQYFLYTGEDELAVRGRVYGPNTFIMGLIAMDGLIFRHLTFVQQPPIPYLVLTAFVMALDVWRVTINTPATHGAATGGALMALVFWALPIRFLGMDKLTAIL